MKNIISFLFLFSFSGFLFAQTPEIANTSPFSIGEKVELFSESLQENRILNICLPQGYDPDSALTYPVIYLLDGSTHEDFIHIAGLVQFCSYPWINHLPPTIVVGIENVDRKRDFTYPSDIAEYQEYVPTAGGSAAFIRFLDKEVKPLINKRYPTTGQSMLIGQSLGGLLAAEILVRHPAMFDSYVIVSPSLWWDEESLLAETAAAIPSPIRVFIAVAEEGRLMRRVAHELYKQTKNRNNISEIHFEFVKDHNHADILHLAVYEAFREMSQASTTHE